MYEGQNPLCNVLWEVSCNANTKTINKENPLPLRKMLPLPYKCQGCYTSCLQPYGLQFSSAMLHTVSWTSSCFLIWLLISVSRRGDLLILLLWWTGLWLTNSIPPPPFVHRTIQCLLCVCWGLGSFGSSIVPLSCWVGFWSTTLVASTLWCFPSSSPPLHCKPSPFDKQFCMENTSVFISYITFQSYQKKIFQSRQMRIFDILNCSFRLD
jgi:hypothetical protein